MRSTCKDCLHKHNVQNKEHQTEYNKKYWVKTKVKQKEKNKIWRDNNKDNVKKTMKIWCENNKEHKKQMDKAYKIANWDKIKASLAKWNRANYADMKSNPNRADELAQYKIKTNTSRRIREILGQDKSEKCMNYVGCTLSKFKIMLETKFTDGMNWNNYGENVNGEKKYAWQIDHKIPCKAFNMTNEVHRKACFHYKNLQPLWWNDNIAKKNSFDPDERDNYIRKFVDVQLLPQI